MSVHFKPDMKPYKNLGSFRMWCQKVLPAVYDESLSYYEVLCKLKDYLNEVIQNVDGLYEDMDALYNAYGQLEDYVNNYFDNLNVQTEINNKLDAMALDGSLSALIAPFVEALLPDEVASRISAVVESQLPAVVRVQLPPELANQLPAEVAQQIPDLVTAWLNLHIVQPVEVIIDDSLTIRGAAADAKTVGDAISELKSALTIYNNVMYYGVLPIGGGPTNIPQDAPTHNTYYNANSGSANYKRIMYWNGTGWTYFGNVTTDDLPVGYKLITVSDINKISNFVFDYVYSLNLFNKSNLRTLENKFIGDNGYTTYENYYVSHPIFVKKGVTYKTPHDSNLGTNAHFAYTDADGTITEITNGTISGNYLEFTPDRYGYVTVNVGRWQTALDAFMVCISEDYPESFVSYNPVLRSDIGLNTKQLDMVRNNPLYGKKLYCEGDSIMKGAGYNGGFAKIIGERNNMTVVNNAVSGATIASDVDGVPHYISTSIASLPNDGDYYIFDGGVNDISRSVTLGTVTYGYDSTLDTTIFARAFEQCCKTLVETFVGKKVGYIFVHRIWNPNDSGANAYFDIMKQILEKWGVPYLNLMDEIPSLNLISSLKSVYTNNGDGWHPNENGYTTFYCDKIEAWLKTL